MHFTPGFFLNFKMITMILLVLYHHCNAFNMLQKIFSVGASFYPQVMGGFYHDPNGIPATLSLNVTSTIPPTANTTGTTMSGASRHNLKVTGVGEDSFIYPNNHSFQIPVMKS